MAFLPHKLVVDHTISLNQSPNGYAMNITIDWDWLWEQTAKEFVHNMPPESLNSVDNLVLTRLYNDSAVGTIKTLWLKICEEIAAVTTNGDVIQAIVGAGIGISTRTASNPACPTDIKTLIMAMNFDELTQ